MRARDEEAAAGAAAKPDALGLDDTPPLARQPDRGGNGTRWGRPAAPIPAAASGASGGREAADGSGDEAGPRLSIWSSLHAAAAADTPGSSAGSGRDGAQTAAAAFVAAALGLPDGADADTLQAVVEAAAREHGEVAEQGQDEEVELWPQAAPQPAPAMREGPNSYTSHGLGFRSDASAALARPPAGAAEGPGSSGMHGTGAYAAAASAAPPAQPQPPLDGNASAAPSEPAPLK